LAASGTVAHPTATATVSTLAPQTTYTAYVRTFCGGTDYSVWTASSAFATPCNPTTILPSTEGFEGSAPCWTVVPISGTGNWALYTTIPSEVPTPHSGAQFAGINWSSAVVTNSLLISPPYNISASGNAQTRVKVWIYRGANGLTTNRITIRVNTSPAAGGTTLLDIPRNMTMAPVVATAGWYEYIANVPVSFNAGTFYITSQGTVGSGFSDYSLGLDDFTLDFNPPTISGFTPANMCASGTDAERTITITGTNFIGTSDVAVNGTAAQSFTVNSSTQISAVVSASATSGTVTVTNGGGTATSTGSLAINQNYPFYADNDADGFGAGSAVSLCSVDGATAPAGYSVNNSDCNDAQLQYFDADGDGFGGDTLVACGVVNTDDCNDAQLQYADNDGDTFGAGVPVACGVSNNSDCNDAQLQYFDADGDGFGGDTVVACGVSNTDD
jgi:hypothetical protein